MNIEVHYRDGRVVHYATQMSAVNAAVSGVQSEIFHMNNDGAHAEITEGPARIALVTAVKARKQVITTIITNID